MKPITVEFNKGVQFPPKLGTLILKPTATGRLAYAQNVDSLNDEYGAGAITPGPALVTIGNNSQLTGVPFAKAFYGISTLSVGYLYFLQGLQGTKTIIRRIKDVVSGSTPTIDVTGSMTVNHTGHANQVLVDILARTDSGNTPYHYVAGKDDTDTWVYKYAANSGSPSLSLIATNTNFTGGLTDQFLVLGSDNKIYWIGQGRVSSIDTSDVYTVTALANGLPLGTSGSAAIDWQGKLIIALSSDFPGSFDRRLSSGRASVIAWDYNSASYTNSPIHAPCRYISAMVSDPSGNLIAFGGVDEGKSSILEFTGYGFNVLYSYIGDLPRSRHSIEFDGQGRLNWLTADGQWCRFDRVSGVFDNLGNLTTDTSSGGLLARAIGSPTGNEFFLASGASSTYTMKRALFGSYIGDGGGSDTTATPLAVSGIQTTPHQTTIAGITWHLTRPLQSGEKVILQVYENGSTTPTTYSTMDYSVDGAILAKRETKSLPNINNFSLGVIWKMTDASATAPAVLPCEVEIQ